MSNNKLRLGKFGEQLAADYLINKGYKILTKNYYTREGEIDLICQKNKVIIFVEVKTRTNRIFGWPEEDVTDEKFEKIATTAEKYLEDNIINKEWQIDIISILINKKTKTAQITHLENITSP